MRNDRILYLDVLRIFSVFCMILLHVAAGNWNTEPPASFDWQVFNVYNSAVRFCVPLFVMISGCLFLDPAKEITISLIFKKNICRILSAFVFWSACYAAFSSRIFMGINLDKSILFFEKLIIGHYHLWFMYMIIGLYLVVPFLRKIVIDKSLMQYFLLLSFIVTCLIPMIQLLIPTLEEIISIVMDKSKVYFVSGYTIYFVAGYYFRTYDTSKKFKGVVFALGISSFFFTIVMTSNLSVQGNQANATLYNNFLPNTAFSALSVFLLIKSIIPKISIGNKVSKMIMCLSSKYSFGIYLVHVLVLMVFKEIGFTTMAFNSVLSVPILSFICFICSFFVVFIISKIPVLNRYII